MPYAIFEGTDRRFSNQRVFWIGAILAAMAGYLNLIMLNLFQVPVSHMTGATTRLSGDLGSLRVDDLLLVASIFFGFLLGAILSGLVVGPQTMQENPRYGYALIFQGLLVAAATALGVLGVQWGVAFGATACGLQNAMAASYRGLVLRTTHVTGIVTDIGVFLGHRLRGRRIHVWKLWLLITLLGGFFVGGLGGVFAYRALGMYALGGTALLSLALGGYYLHWLAHRPETVGPVDPAAIDTERDS